MKRRRPGSQAAKFLPRLAQESFSAHLTLTYLRFPACGQEVDLGLPWRLRSPLCVEDACCALAGHRVLSRHSWRSICYPQRSPSLENPAMWREEGRDSTYYFQVTLCPWLVGHLPWSHHVMWWQSSGMLYLCLQWMFCRRSMVGVLIFRWWESCRAPPPADEQGAAAQIWHLHFGTRARHTGGL